MTRQESEGKATPRGDRPGLARLVRPEDIAVELRGAGNAGRTIYHVIPPEFPAHRLLVVEGVTPPRPWARHPPPQPHVPRPQAARRRGADAARALVQLPAPQARRGPTTRRGEAGGGLLSPPGRPSRLRLPARVHGRARH